VLRSDASLEEYWVVSPTKRLSRIDLPWVPFNVTALKSAVAVLVLDSKAEQEVRLWLTVIEADGKARWKAPLDAITTPSEASDFDRELYSCRSLAVPPQKPWIAVSNCQSIQVFDAQTGARITTIENVPF
jgi:hypothetical protein